MDKQRVNRVAVLLQGEGVIISLYKTNTKLGDVSNIDLGIPNFKETRLKLVTTNEPEAILELLEQIREKFRDVPMNQNVTSIYEDKQQS